MFWYQKIVLNTKPSDAGHTLWMMLAKNMLAHMKEIYSMSDMPYPYPIPDATRILQRYLGNRRRLDIAIQQYRKKLNISEEEWRHLPGFTDDHILSIFVATLEYIWRRRGRTVAALDKYTLNAIQTAHQEQSRIDQHYLFTLRSKVEEILHTAQSILNGLPQITNQSEQHTQQAVESPANTSQQQTDKQNAAKKSTAKKSASKKPTVQTPKGKPTKQTEIAPAKQLDNENIATPVAVSEKLAPIASLYLPAESLIVYLPSAAKHVRIVKLLSACKQLCEQYAITPKTAITSKHGRLTLYPVWLLSEAYKACNVTV